MSKAPLRTPVMYSEREVEVRLVTLRDVQNNIDGCNTPIAIRRALAAMVEEAMLTLDTKRREAS